MINQIILIFGPVVLSSLVTFFITRYNFQRNKTEVIEKSYDRFYYPCYIKLKEYEQDKKYQELLSYVKNRAVKWNKYIDKTTLKCIDGFDINANLNVSHLS